MNGDEQKVYKVGLWHDELGSVVSPYTRMMGNYADVVTYRLGAMATPVLDGTKLFALDSLESALAWINKGAIARRSDRDRPEWAHHAELPRLARHLVVYEAIATEVEPRKHFLVYPRIYPSIIQEFWESDTYWITETTGYTPPGTVCCATITPLVVVWRGEQVTEQQAAGLA